ncbi:ATPase, T2SS/T4P/T4SS family [Halovenus rubra]|uniref:ATPase, T2SS/T4P/T4SS family n=2 Tax=Halovenus rubra TaxID=869890 RepID=A0ACC7DXB4_9EURY|nr:ATPase, T2SS/T4P/T4SS family [Halovenus rubra]
MTDITVPSIARLQSLFSHKVDAGKCRCQTTFDEEALVIDATDCPHNGTLEACADCRETAINALTTRDVTVVRTESDGVERRYGDRATALLVAAGRFVERVTFHDERLAEQARRDPLGACREATGRADTVGDLAAETGLAEVAATANKYETALAPSVKPTLSHWRVDATPPPEATLRGVKELETGGTVRTYNQATGSPRYYLSPIEHTLPPEALSTLAEAYRRLASGTVEGGKRAPARAIRAVITDRYRTNKQRPTWTKKTARVLRKHTRGYGLLEDLFTDQAVTDAFITAPAAENRLRVTTDSETFITNLTVTENGITALASRFRRESGRAFSRADPTLDATAEIGGRQLRVAGVTEPPSDGIAFAFRAQAKKSWTLPALVKNNTIPPSPAALLSVAVERGSAVLIVGPRGTGKTTMLGALLWELPPEVRTVIIEDTPELPVSALQNGGRDVQALLASSSGEELTPAAALRTALRLGDGALAVGEVRGEEAKVLYEAMRVGANSEAVLGTIHGDGGDAVYERVVSDLGVSPSSFGVTDLVVSLESTTSGKRRVKTIEEVQDGEQGAFRTLYEQSENGLHSTGVVDRGNSQLVRNLTAPDESYDDLRAVLADRQTLLAGMAAQGATTGDAVTDSQTERN